jgi:hypothetical protein
MEGVREVLCGCGVTVHAYDDKTHEERCPGCGERKGRWSTPQEYFDRVKAVEQAARAVVAVDIEALTMSSTTRAMFDRLRKALDALSPG